MSWPLLLEYALLNTQNHARSPSRVCILRSTGIGTPTQPYRAEPSIELCSLRWTSKTRSTECVSRIFKSLFTMATNHWNLPQYEAKLGYALTNMPLNKSTCLVNIQSAHNNTDYVHHFGMRANVRVRSIYLSPMKLGIQMKCLKFLIVAGITFLLDACKSNRVSCGWRGK